MKIHYVKKQIEKQKNDIWPDVPVKLHIYVKYKLTSAFSLQFFFNIHTLYSIKFSFYSKKYCFMQRHLGMKQTNKKSNCG